MSTAGEWWSDRAGFDGTVAVVTGGAGGLGEAITRDLLTNGVRVAVIDRDAEAISALESDHTLITHVGDARDPDQLSALFAATDERWGRVDFLVNVVGGTFRGPFEEQTPKAWDALIRSNLTHVLHATSLAIPRMKAGGRGGSIVNITTIEAHRAAPNFAVYSAAKAAVTQFARTMALELGPERIRINNVAPDIAPTPNMLRLGGGEGTDGGGVRDPLNTTISVPLGRLGATTDISNAVVFLLSGLAAYITGTTLHPDGGTLASSGWFNWPADGFMNTVPPSLLDTLRD